MLLGGTSVCDVGVSLGMCGKLLLHDSLLVRIQLLLFVDLVLLSLVHGFVFLHVFLSKENADAGLAFFLFTFQVLDEFLKSELDDVLGRSIAGGEQLLLVRAKTFSSPWVEKELEVVIKELSLEVTSIDKSCCLRVKGLIDIHNWQFSICEVIANCHEYVFNHLLSSLCSAVL